MKRTLSLLLNLVVPLLALASPPAIRLSGTDNGIQHYTFSYLRDSTGFTERDFLDHQKDAAFTAYNPEAPFNPGVGVFWLKMQLINTDPAARNYFLEVSNWVGIDFYYTDSSGAVVHKKSGHLTPFNDRDYGLANRNLISLEMAPGDTLDAYVRLESSVNFLQIPSKIEITSSEQKTFLTKEAKHRMFIGMFVGFYLIMLLYNLFVYISTRDRNYVFYLVVLFTMVLITLHNNGYLVHLLRGIPNYVHFHSEMQFILSTMLGNSMIWYTLRFLDVKRRFPFWGKFMNVLAIFIFFLPVPSMLGYANLNEMFSGMLGISSMALILTVAIKAFRAKVPSSQYFLIAYGMFTLGIMIQLTYFLGILPPKVMDYYPLNVGSTFEMVFFSFALANRINLLDKDNREKQEKLIHQLRENEELQTKVNRELEQKVKDRTVEIEREKNKSEALLLNILPEEVAAELKERGHAVPRYYAKTTVLFTDFVSFTRKTENMPPREVIDMLDYCFAAFDRILEKYNMEKIKTIGDGYLAAGGLPTENSTNPVDAILAGLEIQEFMKAWQEMREREGKDIWEIRIGIHTGDLIAGVVGTKKFAYDIWGDTVNTGARMETASEAGRVNVSGATYELTKQYFNFTSRGKIFVKNKGEVEMYFADSVKPEALPVLKDQHTS